MISKALFSSNSDEWTTPPVVLYKVREMWGKINLDPATTASNPVGAKYFIYLPQDGLKEDWMDKTFVNPPYSALKEWARKIGEEGKLYEVIALVPARTDTVWFRELGNVSAYCFWKGRLKFSGSKNSAPFPSVLVYYGDDEAKFAEVFGECGEIMVP
jgi:phage N-6-adenine-methyltransferase